MRALIKLRRSEKASDLSKEFKVSRRQVYRIWAEPPAKRSARTTKRNLGGRPSKLDARTKRHIFGQMKLLRQTEPNWTIKRLIESAGISGDVSVWTVSRFLNEHGYNYRQIRRKGLLSNKDKQTRADFAKMVLSNYDDSLWTEKIAFYLDGISFAYKRNPKSQGQGPTGRIWRRQSEGLLSGCTSKGSKSGTGGKYVRIIAAISYDKGVVAHVPYEKMDGNYFASFISEQFETMFLASGKNTNTWIQDGDPSQNSAVARAKMDEIGAELFPIPPRSPDINPIENFFHLVRRKLTKDAIDRDITFETIHDFQSRIIQTMHDIPLEHINKTIRSLPKRMKEIIKCKGERLKY